jgi:hypothetical protein
MSRPKGSKNRPKRHVNPLTKREAVVAQSGVTPLEYMLRIMRDPRASKERRDDMAKAAARFVHPILGAIASIQAPQVMPDQQKTIQHEGNVVQIDDPVAAARLYTRMIKQVR